MTAKLATITTQQKSVSAFANQHAFEAAQRMAKALCSSTLVPQHYRGQENIGNAIIALEMAQRMEAAPLQVMQNLYLVHGQPAWSAKFLIATFNQCGKFSAIKYEWRGEPGADDYGCRALATEKATGTDIKGPWIDWQLVKAEGWNSKNGSKWRTMPDKMFMYRAAAWMIDLYAPELSMGLPTAEDARDYIDVDPSTGEIVGRRDTATDLEQALAGKIEPDPETPADETVSYDVLMDSINAAADAEELATCEELARAFDKRTKEGKTLAAAIENRRNALSEAATDA